MQLGDDLLSGASAIAAFLGMTPRTVYDLAEKGRIPTFKLGNRIYARKSELDQCMRAKKNG